MLPVRSVLNLSFSQTQTRGHCLTCQDYAHHLCQVHMFSLNLLILYQMSSNLSMIFYSANFFIYFFANCQFVVKINHTNNEGERTQMYSFPIFSLNSLLWDRRRLLFPAIYTWKLSECNLAAFFIWKGINKNWIYHTICVKQRESVNTLLQFSF